MTTHILEQDIAEGLSDLIYKTASPHPPIGYGDVVWDYMQTRRVTARFGEGKAFLKVDRSQLEWIMPVFETLCHLLTLQPNWDSYGARTIQRESVITALEILSEAVDVSKPRPSVVPTVHGGVQLEWDVSGIGIELEIKPTSQIEVYYEDKSGQVEEWEGDAKVDLNRVEELLNRLPSEAYR